VWGARKDCERIPEDTERDYSKTEYGKNVLVVGDGENSPAMRRRCAREDRVDLREGRREQLTMDDGGMDSRGYRVTTVRQNMERTRWWLAMEMMVKILGDANSRRRRGCKG
jgi:hypothetical protein